MIKLLPYILAAVMGYMLYDQQKKIDKLNNTIKDTSKILEELVEAHKGESYRNMIIDNNLYGDMYKGYEVYEEYDG
jgi:hypothetical protein